MISFLPKKSMRFVFIVGDAGAVLVGIGADKNVGTFFAASDDAAARKKMLNQVAQIPQARVTILYNGTDQEFRSEALPPVGYFDRLKLVKRRLQHTFPKAYATSSRLLDSTNVMMAAVSQAASAAMWVDALLHQIPALGLLPVEAAAMMARLLPQAHDGWAMLLAEFQTGGLRQIVTHKGRLVFTRLLDGFSQVDKIPRMVEESKAYLARFGLAAEAEFPVFHLIADKNEITTEKLSALKNYRVFSLVEAARLCNISDAQCDTVDAFFAAWLGARSLQLPLVASAVKVRWRQQLINQTGWRMAVIVSAFAAFLAVCNLFSLASQLYQNHQAEHVVEDLRQQLQAEQVSQAPAGQPLGKLFSALERQRIFMEPQPEPWDLLRQLATALEGKTRVVAADWRDDGSLRLSVRVDAEGSADYMNREKTVRDLKVMTEQLRQAMPSYSVDVMRYPFPATPQETISSAIADTGISAGPLTADIVLRRQP